MRQMKGGDSMSLSVNISKLKGKITEHDFTIEQLSTETGISTDTLYRRFKDGKKFTIEEVNKIVFALNLSAREAMEIFFAEYVA